MRIFLLTFHLLNIHVSSVLGQSQPDYSVEGIKKQLKINAHAVVRNDQTQLVIKEANKATFIVDKAITILDQGGSALAPVYIYYDSYKKIKNANVRIFDSKGRLTKEIELSGFSDHAATQPSTLFEDSRFKVYAHAQEDYPYTIAYRYEQEFTDIYQYPIWNPIRAENVGIEKGQFRFTIANKIGFEYKAYHLDEPSVYTDGDSTQYSWQLKNIKPIAKEAFAPDFYRLAPTLLLSPDTVIHAGERGSAKTWKSFSQWVNRLTLTQQDLPDSIVDKATALCRQVASKKEKVEALYDYIQTNYHYVNIPVGIGTYQPSAASQVIQARGGDSKALVNLMQALLKVVGIESSYALASSGVLSSDVEPSLPGAQFNRAVLKVPLEESIIWLDFSDPLRPMGYLGYDLSGSDVLVASPTGSQLSSITAYKTSQNIQFRKTGLHITPEGTAQGKVNTLYAGLQYAHASPILLLPDAQKMAVVNRKFNLPQAIVDSLSYHIAWRQQPALQENISVTIQRYVQPYAKKLSFVPNVLNQMDGLPPYTDQRQHPIEIRKAFVDADTTVIAIPDNMVVDRLPADVDLNSKFGVYKMNIKKVGNQLIYTRYFETFLGSFPAYAYPSLLDFYESIVKADQKRVVLDTTDKVDKPPYSSTSLK